MFLLVNMYDVKTVIKDNEVSTTGSQSTNYWTTKYQLLDHKVPTTVSGWFKVWTERRESWNLLVEKGMHTPVGCDWSQSIDRKEGGVWFSWLVFYLPSSFPRVLSSQEQVCELERRERFWCKFFPLLLRTTIWFFPPQSTTSSFHRCIHSYWRQSESVSRKKVKKTTHTLPFFRSLSLHISLSFLLSSFSSLIPYFFSHPLTQYSNMMRESKVKKWS